MSIRGRLFRSLMLAIMLFLVAAAFADERVLVVPGVGIHIESDQERVYVIPGRGIYVETLPAPAVGRRVMVVN